MALAERASRRTPKGSPTPRIAPPTPARAAIKEFTDAADAASIKLYPWQLTAAKYLTALGRGTDWLYPEVAIIVGRQNGKTTLLLPLILSRLLAGRQMIHAAQNMKFPRQMHDQVARIIEAKYRHLLPRRRGIQYGAGNESINLTNGGRYSIVAATQGSARGTSNDLVIVDEIREFESWDFVAAAAPTLTASSNPQMVYLSNAGSETSVVLNSLRKRAQADPVLAYLEWSAAPDREADDIEGWLEANPSIGHREGMWESLGRYYESYRLAETPALWETEHLCRWVVTMKPTILPVPLWELRAAAMEKPLRPVMGLALDQLGTRASAAIAWQRPNGMFGVKVVAEAIGDPIDLDDFGPKAVALANQLGCRAIVYDPYDEHFARHFRKPIAMNGRDYANACASFVRLLEAGQLTHEDAEAITADLAWTTKRHTGPGAWMAVKANDEHPVTALLAAIRAVGHAYGPRTIGLRVR